MSFDINGTFSRNYDFETDRINGIKIMSDRVDGEFDNFATAMNQTFLRSGEAPMGANLRMGSFRLTGLGDGSAANPSVTFTNDASSGLYRVGANQIGMSIAGVLRAQWDSAGVTAVMNAKGAGTPLTVNSTDSTATKISLQDNGVTRGKIASTAAQHFQVQDASGVTQLQQSSTVLTSFTNFTSMGPSANFGPTSGAALDGDLVIQGTNVYDRISFRHWPSGDYSGQIIGDHAALPGLRFYGVPLIQLSTANAALGTVVEQARLDTTGLKVASGQQFWLGDNILRRNDGTAILTYAASLTTFANTISVSGNANINGLVENITGNVTAPGANASNSYMWRDATNGMCVQGAGSSYNASLMNRSGNRVIGVNDNAYKAEYQGNVGAASQNSGEIGWRDLVPQSKSATYALVLNDRGSLIPITTGGITVPDNSSVAFPVGTMITVYNDSGSAQTISMTGTDTLRLGGTASTGSRSLAARGLANLVKVKTTEWLCGGPGVS